MKKKLLIIGNKPLDKDYSSYISSFDKVIRVNKMTNYNNCSGKTDLWLADIFNGSEELYSLEDSEKFKKSKRAITFSHSYESTKTYFEEHGINVPLEPIEFDSIGVNKYIPMHEFNKSGCRVTNAVWCIIYALEKFKSEYEIYLLGCGRRDFLNSPSEHPCHYQIYMAEDYFLLSLVNDGTIISLDGEFGGKIHFDTRVGYTGNIPCFSSFWHSNISFLPNIVVASINSFVKQGCPYHLYTYHGYSNIPKGCILEDANTIIPKSEFFMGRRKDYASFADYFRVVLVNRLDTAWTDTDNFFISDSFPTRNVLIIQDGRIQNGFFYLDDTERSTKFKRLLLDFYENPSRIQRYDNDEMISAKQDISCFEKKIDMLSNAKWGIGGSCLYTNINSVVPMDECAYDYSVYFNGFHYTNQFQLWNYEEQPYMLYRNRNVRILTMSMALLQREPSILRDYNEKSYMGKLIQKYS